MSRTREPMVFAVVLAALIAAFLGESLFGGKVLSSGDVVYASASFGDGSYEPANRLLMDPVIQFAPWIEFNRSRIRRGELPLWNPWAGCGAPHLANGQSAVFDPFHLIAYLGTLPKAHAWMAAARLWTAGLGMFLLARSWGLRRWGRWSSGLAYPFCGFLVLWLLYPVTSVAIWMPWLLLATDTVLNRPGPRSVAGLAVVVGFVLLGGHIQTSAHVLLYSGLYTVWKCWPRRDFLTTSKLLPPLAWSLGILVGVSLAAAEVVPLASYLSRSPVWADRKAELVASGRLPPPRWLDSLCLGLPYAFGSQRHGQPNLARALGMSNLNEAAGGFAGLATLIWLAPLAFSSRGRTPRVRFLTGMTAAGGLGAFGFPPVATLLRLLPVMDVADNRRLLLWVAFGLVLLGGIGLDSLDSFVITGRWKWWTRSWLALALIAVFIAVSVVVLGPRLREKSIAHYAKAAANEPGADLDIYRQRAERQARLAVTFLPRYYLLAAGHLSLLAILAEAVRRRWIAIARARAALLGLTVIDLFCFGFGVNPAITPADDRPVSDVVAYLRREVPPPLRIVSVGAELPPNLLMRYGLADARNYDSIELTRNLDWFEPMYEPDRARPLHTSRREVRWEGVIRAEERLRLAGVVAVVGASKPPAGVFDRLDRVGRVWVGRWSSLAPAIAKYGPGEIRVDLRGDNRQVRWVAETFDPGWQAEIDGSPVAIRPHLGAFLGVVAPPGARQLVFRYRPADVRIGLFISLISSLAIGVLLCFKDRPRNKALVSWTPWRRPVRIEKPQASRSLRTGPPLH